MEHNIRFDKICTQAIFNSSLFQLLNKKPGIFKTLGHYHWSQVFKERKCSYLQPSQFFRMLSTVRVRVMPSPNLLGDKMKDLSKLQLQSVQPRMHLSTPHSPACASILQTWKVPGKVALDLSLPSALKHAGDPGHERSLINVFSRRGMSGPILAGICHFQEEDKPRSTWFLLCMSTCTLSCAVGWFTAQ